VKNKIEGLTTESPEDVDVVEEMNPTETSKEAKNTRSERWEYLINCLILIKNRKFQKWPSF